MINLLFSWKTVLSWFKNCK